MNETDEDIVYSSSDYSKESEKEWFHDTEESDVESPKRHSHGQDRLSKDISRKFSEENQKADEHQREDLKESSTRKSSHVGKQSNGGHVLKSTDVTPKVLRPQVRPSIARMSHDFKMLSENNMISSTFIGDVELTDDSDDDSSVVQTKTVKKYVIDDTDSSADGHEESDNEIINSSSGNDTSIVPTKPNMFSTPSRNVKPEIESDSDNSSDSVQDDDIPVVELSSSSNASIELVKENVPEDTNGKRPTTMKQTKMDSFLQVTPSEYHLQNDKIKQIENELTNARNTLRIINLNTLPDKGRALQERPLKLELELAEQRRKLENMVISKKEEPPARPILWSDIQAGASNVQPRTMGKMAMSTYNAQRALTLDTLQELHGSLKTCPQEGTLAQDPKGLEVELMDHQRRALAWLMWRENQKPSGGILADDMGLGKTLTMISLMLKTLETEKGNTNEEHSERSSYKYHGGTLVICPASLINQWTGELERRTKRGLATCEIFHGPNRERKASRLASYHMVVTTYSIIHNDSNGVLSNIKWRRIILDEAHHIRNHKTKTSLAICELGAKSRWAVTGTPIHNKELDMYSLLKFLRCSPFDDLPVWKRWVGDKSTGGQDRLHTVISSLMLRRTKVELIESGHLKAMTSRKWELINIEPNKDEMNVYHKILIFSKTLFAQFLYQKADRNQDMISHRDLQSTGPNSEYFKMRQKLLHHNRVKDVSQHEILVLLLRLRQICCHPTLITAMLDEGDVEKDDNEEYEELNLLEQLNKLNIEDDNPNQNVQGDAVTLKDGCKGFLNPKNPVFSNEYKSTKIAVMLKMLNKIISETEDKVVIVSQWPSFLRLIAAHLPKMGIKFDQLDGSVVVLKRMAMVDNFNDPKHKMRVLLLSLTAGGVGLNLIGANHLFLLDLHWNPQLEYQAQDRIYRMGQEKPVYVYKFIANGTIEERIRDLQEKKTGLAEALITGSKQIISTKLSLQDLRMLFEM